MEIESFETILLYIYDCQYNGIHHNSYKYVSCYIQM